MISPLKKYKIIDENNIKSRMKIMHFIFFLILNIAIIKLIITKNKANKNKNNFAKTKNPNLFFSKNALPSGVKEEYHQVPSISCISVVARVRDRCRIKM